MRAERPVDNWGIIPPPSEEGPGRIPPGPRRRADQCARAPQKEASDGYPEGHHREHPTTSAEGSVRDARTPASGTGRAVEHNRHCWHCCTDARCRQPAWDISTDARYIPLVVTTTPSQCRQPPRGADNARPCGARHCPASPLGESPGLVPLPPGYAHKDPDLRNTRCTQRLDSALVCDPVFPNSLPCVRHQEERAPRPVNPRPRQFQPRPRA